MPRDKIDDIQKVKAQQGRVGKRGTENDPKTKSPFLSQMVESSRTLSHSCRHYVVQSHLASIFIQ